MYRNLTLALVATIGVTFGSIGYAQAVTDEFGNTTYPANLAGVDMSSVPDSDLLALDGNLGLTPEAQALVAAEIAARGGLDALVVGLGATNLAALAPAFATVLIAALAAGGDGGGTSDTQ
jgi:hypothetical protein